MDNFKGQSAEKTITGVMNHEGLKDGKLVNLKEPDRVGGASILGMTRQSFDWYKSKHPDLSLPAFDQMLKVVQSGSEDLKKQVKDVVFKFYLWFFGDYGNANYVPDFLQVAYCNWFAMSGLHAVEALQEIVGLTGDDVDGAWGPITRKVVPEFFDNLEASLETNPTADDDIHEAYIQKMREHCYKQNPEHVAGYKKRIDEIFAAGLEFVSDGGVEALPKHHDHEFEEELQLDPAAPTGLEDRVATMEGQIAEILELLKSKKGNGFRGQ